MQKKEEKKIMTPTPPGIDSGDKDVEHQIELQKLDAMKEMAKKMGDVGNAADFIKFFLAAIKGDKGDKGEPGKDADEPGIIEKVMAKVKAMIPTAQEVSEILKPLIKGDKGDKGDRGDKGDKGDAPLTSDIVDFLLSSVDFLKKAKGPKGDKGDSIQGPPGKDGSPDTGKDIVAKINAGEDQIDASKIKGIFGGKNKNRNDIGYLRELSDVEILEEPTGAFALVWSLTKKKWVPVNLGAGGGVPLAVDISSQFDGVATTFTLPAYSAILMFNITGWPPNGALRPTVDFTTPSSTSVALTAEVPAPESGATGIVLIIPA